MCKKSAGDLQHFLITSTNEIHRICNNKIILPITIPETKPTAAQIKISMAIRTAFSDDICLMERIVFIRIPSFSMTGMIAFQNLISMVCVMW
jgi:hypothetical protein